MKTPICEICAVTASLCSGCQARLENKEISEVDVKISQLLYKHKSHFQLDDVHFLKAFDCDNIIYLLTRSEPGFLVGKKGKIISVLSKEVGRHLRVVKETSDHHKLIEELLHPVNPLGVNTVFKATGTAIKVRIAKRDLPRLPTNLPALQNVLTKLLNKEVQLSFE